VLTSLVGAALFGVLSYVAVKAAIAPDIPTTGERIARRPPMADDGKSSSGTGSTAAGRRDGPEGPG
jgi:hypothetical protein